MERNKTQWMLTLAVLAGLCLAAGCTPYAERKAVMESRWDQSAAKAKLPMAEEYLKQGQLTDAYKLLTKCLAADPELAEGHLLMGRLHLAEGQTNEAKESFRRAVAFNFQLDEAWFALGMVAQDQEDYIKAEEHYEKALAFKPLNADYILRLAYLYDLQDRMEEAEGLISASLEQLPGEVRLMTAQAEMYQRRGLHAQAAKLLGQARHQSGNDPQVLEMLGTCLMSQREWTAAQKVFEELLATKDLEGYETILQWTATCALNAGSYSRALKYYDQLSVHRREDPAIWLAMAQAAMGADMPARGRQCAEKALQLQPGWTEAQAVQGCAYYMEKEYARAAGVFERLERDETWSTFGWWMAGRCYQQLGQTARAQQAFQKASSLQPESPLMKMFTFGPGEKL